MLRRLVVFALCAVLFGAIQVRSAFAGDKPHNGPHGYGPGGNPTAPRDIPEFDPATVGAIAAIVAGGGVLVARRRKR